MQEPMLGPGNHTAAAMHGLPPVSQASLHSLAAVVMSFNSCSQYRPCMDPQIEFGFYTSVVQNIPTTMKRVEGCWRRFLLSQDPQRMAVRIFCQVSTSDTGQK